METYRFHTLEELNQLSLRELQVLWELVPTDRQRSYRAAYDREVRNAGAIGSDNLERQVAELLLQRYEESALVPVGMRWAKTPSRVQSAAQTNDMLDFPDTASSTVNDKPSPKVMIFLAVMGIMLLAFFLMRGGSYEESNAELSTEPTPTPTPEVSPTPTPLALEAQDDVIQGGDSERAVAYPVNLQIVPPDNATPRVWVIQRRAVRTAEWNYDPNPDVASFINGMPVRPVIGIPWSEDNAAWFESMSAGTSFTLTMNTGAILQYEFAEKTEVRRSDTGIFRQVGPGLVLLLIGEVDDMGLPTATRTLVTGSYPPEQELSRDGERIGLNLPTPFPTTQLTVTFIPQAETFTDVDVQIISVTTQEGRLNTRFRIYNSGTQSIIITPDDITLTLGYEPEPIGPHTPAEGLEPFTLLPEQVADLSLVWAWDGEPHALMMCYDFRFVIQLLKITQ
jgi:hypothetical protein